MPTTPIDLAIVVMTKRPVAGRVKTRLIRESFLDAQGAADVARAMLECTVARLLDATDSLYLAVTPDPGPHSEVDSDADSSGEETAGAYLPPTLAGRVRLLGQGRGDLGARLDHVWREVGMTRAVAFFGSDSPDIPEAATIWIAAGLAEADLALGPTPDGGYWVLAARRYAPEAISGIDWGGPSVYDQTRSRAREAGLSLASLPAWHDVDHPADVEALIERLAGQESPPLRTLASKLAALRVE